MTKYRLALIGSFLVFLLVFVLAARLKYSSDTVAEANGSHPHVSSQQGGPPTPVVLTAPRIDAHSVDLHWTDPQGNSGFTGYEIYRNGRKAASSDKNTGPYFKDAHLTASQSYTYAIATVDPSGRRSLLSADITIKTLADGNGNVYTISPNDPPATIYGILDNAGCGDTVNIKPGTYSVANGHAAMIYIKDKHCTTGQPYLIRAADPTAPPIFDYSQFPLDGQTSPVANHWTPWESDFFRGAWQVHTSSFVILDGLRIRGANAKSTDAVAGVRYVSTDHFTIRRSILERNWDGLEGNGTNTTVEYNTFLANGVPGEDQQHQFYDTGGDELTVRYNYFNDDGCEECGQNLHTRSWHSYIYGNWIQDGSDYEWDMMTPPPDYPAPADGNMSQQFYNNVVVTSTHPRNTTKVFTFFADGAGMAARKMRLNAQWNTFWIRSQSGFWNTYSLFQVSNYAAGPNSIAAIDLHFSNNIVHFVQGSLLHRYKAQLFDLKDQGRWSIEGTNNWFDSSLGSPCSPSGGSNSGSCRLVNSTAGGTPPFRNVDGLDLRPATPNHPFGLANSGESLRSPNQQFPPGSVSVKPRTSFDDVGALQYSQ